MKGILEFNLPEEKYEFELAQNGALLSAALHEISSELRKIVKYEDSEYASLTGPEAIAKFRERFFEIVNEFEAGSHV